MRNAESHTLDEAAKIRIVKTGNTFANIGNALLGDRKKTGIIPVEVGAAMKVAETIFERDADGKPTKEQKDFRNMFRAYRVYANRQVGSCLERLRNFIEEASFKSLTGYYDSHKNNEDRETLMSLCMDAENTIDSYLLTGAALFRGYDLTSFAKKFEYAREVFREELRKLEKMVRRNILGESSDCQKIHLN